MDWAGRSKHHVRTKPWTVRKGADGVGTNIEAVRDAIATLESEGRDIFPPDLVRLRLEEAGVILRPDTVDRHLRFLSGQIVRDHKRGPTELVRDSDGHFRRVVPGEDLGEQGPPIVSRTRSTSVRDPDLERKRPRAKPNYDLSPEASAQGKYGPLYRFLVENPADTVVLSLSDVESLLGTELPQSAFQPGWWSNSRGRPHARSWMVAGWLVAFDRPRKVVRFTRSDSDSSR